MNITPPMRLALSAILILIPIMTMADSFSCSTYGNTTDCHDGNSHLDLTKLYGDPSQYIGGYDDFAKGQMQGQEIRLRQLQIQEMEMRLEQQKSAARNQSLPYKPSGNPLPVTLADCEREYPSTKGNFRSQVRCYKSIDERNGILTAEAESLYADWMSMALRADNGQVVPKSDLDAFNIRVSAYAAKKGGNSNAAIQDSSKAQKLETAKAKCSSLGFKKGTVKHGDCVIKLIE